MTDAADVLEVRPAAPPGTDGPVTGIAGEMPAGARSPCPDPQEPADSPVSRPLPRDLVLRALL